MAGAVADLIGIALGLAVGYQVALDLRSRGTAASPAASFGVFVLVAFFCGSFFRELLALLVPLLQGAGSAQAVIGFVGGLGLLVLVARAYLALGGSTSSFQASLRGGQVSTPDVKRFTDEPPPST